MLKNTKKKVIFVTGLGKTNRKQHPGGQLTTSKILLESEFSDHFNIFVVDSTAVSHPPEGIIVKLTKSIKRFTIFIWLCISKRPHAALIFSSCSYSFFEKTLLCLLSRIFKVRSLLAIRSGHFLKQVEHAKYSHWYNILLRIPNILVCQSQMWVDFYTKMGIPLEKCWVVPNWIDSKQYFSCRSLQPSGKNVTFLFVGWVVRAKGIWELLNAVNIIIDKLADANWIIVGSGDEYNNAKDFIEKHGLDSKIKMTGWQSRKQLINYYEMADIFVLPTHAEGFPNVILEAMSAGLPIITTPVGGIPGLLHDGIECIFVQPHNAKELADAMLHLAEDSKLRQNLSNSSINHVRKFHDISVTWKKLAALIDDSIPFVEIRKETQ